MRYLITGGAGFIGSHLADALIERGDEVHVLDNLSTGEFENVQHLADHERFTLTVGNVLDYRTLEQCVVQCDCTVHLAAAVGVRLIMERPVGTIQANIGGTENVLQLAHYHDKKALVASTSEVYGKAMQKNGGPDALSEDDDWTLGPTGKRRWAYACSKAMDEFLAQAYHDEHGVPVVCARFFNTVGPRQSGRYGMVIPTFVERALADEPIEVHGDGTQTRCFLHVSDAIDAILGLLDTPDAVCEVVNVGRPDEISINELAQRVIEHTDSASEIEHIPYEDVYGPGFEDMKRRTPDISKLQSLIDFTPTNSTDDILRDVVAYSKEEEASGASPSVMNGVAVEALSST
ncbi:UDP-glucose 4-epimerase [Salinibacter ruber]|uniref:NAD-dependent epimerase/dehydratase family protein n=1 Tax=Salinibacter ruber TaxID=146919 RepID=UPI000E580AC9|nr:NAD-dependent epimerase/dehydratase family protein [Salinibacter ruber]MCS3705900.1 UDP-glucose 4-epimerase [Salinibacter ruber]